MEDLTLLRKKIDEIDEKIAGLYLSRMAVSQKIAEDKIRTGKAVYDRIREEEKLKALRLHAASDFDRQGITELFEQIMSLSRKRQYHLHSEGDKERAFTFRTVEKLDTRNSRVVFQGAEGAYSQAAMDSYFGDAVDSFHVASFKDAMVLVTEGKADFAVLPIENSIAGAVTEVYDLLAEFDNCIVAEQELRIEHCLIGLIESRIEDIRTVVSHPMSLLQSAGFLARYPEWQKVACENNAFAARSIKEGSDKACAAIAGEKAAAIYGLKVLKKDISRSAANTTRFIIITKQKIHRRDAGKISICFEVPHQSGSLYHMLSHFIFNRLSMDRIESRPISGRNWEYRFFIDFGGNLNDIAVKNALNGLKAEAVKLKILGNY